MNRLPNNQLSSAAGRPARRRRGGALTVELVLTLPLLLVVVLAVIQFSMLLISSQAVSAAANVGVRQASLPSATAAAVQSAVFQSLTGWKFQGEAEVVIYVNGVSEMSSPGELAASNTGDLVTVTVNVPSIEASPDLLKLVGFSIADQTLTATYVMRKE